MGERVELAVRRSLDFHGGGAEASASTRFTKKKRESQFAETYSVDLSS